MNEVFFVYVFRVLYRVGYGPEEIFEIIHLLLSVLVR